MVMAVTASRRRLVVVIACGLSPTPARQPVGASRRVQSTRPRAETATNCRSAAKYGSRRVLRYVSWLHATGVQIDNRLWPLSNSRSDWLCDEPSITCIHCNFMRLIWPCRVNHTAPGKPVQHCMAKTRSAHRLEGWHNYTSPEKRWFVWL